MTVFPDPLPTNSTDRLRAVANILRTDSTQWDQQTWIRSGGRPAFCITPYQAVNRFKRVDCGTNTACIAGWALLLTPHDTLRELPGANRDDGWADAGKAALGLKPGNYYDGVWYDVAAFLFQADLQLSSIEVAEILDALADLPEHKRSWDELAYKNEPLAIKLANA